MRNKKMTLNVSILLWVVLSSCTGEVTSSNHQPASPEYSQLAELLEHAYQQHSQDALNTFFESWMDALAAYTFEEITAFSDTVRQVYSVFREFYSPTELGRLTEGQHENFETDFRYIVVQNSMEVAVVDTDPRYYFHEGVTSREQRIDDFRPPQGELPLPVVYLSSQTDSVIYRFLYQENGTPKADHQSRVGFLRQAMQLTHHHWFSDYHKATMPIVLKIYMDDSLTQAVVIFRVFYQFGDAYLERRNIGWTLISSRLTGIE